MNLHLPDNCDYCNMNFSTNQELMDHAQLDEIIEVSGPPYVNSVIIEPNNDNSNEEEENVYHCTECAAKCESETELDDHVEKEHITLPKDKKNASKTHRRSY